MKRYSLTCKCLILHHLDSGSNGMIFTPILFISKFTYDCRNHSQLMYVSRTTSLPKSLQLYVGEKLTKPRKKNLIFKNQTDCSYILMEMDTLEL